MTEIHVPQKSHIIANHYTDHYTITYFDCICDEIGGSMTSGVRNLFSRHRIEKNGMAVCQDEWPIMVISQ